MNRDEAALALGYAEAWTRYGLLPEEVLLEQLAAFDRGDDRSTEHYRYASFRRLYPAMSDELLPKLFELIDADPDALMAEAVLRELLSLRDLTDQQFELVAEHLRTWQHSAAQRARSNTADRSDPQSADTSPSERERGRLEAIVVRARWERRFRQGERSEAFLREAITTPWGQALMIEATDLPHFALAHITSRGSSRTTPPVRGPPSDPGGGDPPSGR